MPHPKPVAELIAAGMVALGIISGTILADDELAYVIQRRLTQAR